jgi:hypothetical protein
MRGGCGFHVIGGGGRGFRGIGQGDWTASGAKQRQGRGREEEVDTRWEEVALLAAKLLPHVLTARPLPPQIRALMVLRPSSRALPTVPATAAAAAGAGSREVGERHCPVTFSAAVAGPRTRKAP